MMKDLIKPFLTNHEDIVLDITYDYYGKQLATCSADNHIKIFDLNNGNWILNESFKAHDSTIVKILFTKPEFGNLLISISYDRCIKIWQEQFDELLCSGLRWKRICIINDSYGPLYDLCLSPTTPINNSLKFATIGSDGKLRIYENLNPCNLSLIELIFEIDVLKNNVNNQLQSDFNVVWSKSLNGLDLICVSALDQAYIYANTTNDAGDNNTINFEMKCLLGDHNGLIRSIDWAPNMGKSYHLIATGCKDGYLRIFKLIEINNNLEFKIELIDSFNDHKGEIWKVSWNTTGTILSSCGDDGLIRLYKSNYANKFQCMSIITSN
ncbi:hypothetical protein CANARDRAFT_235673 [[Candida] arabinofermentans NRRL YB-2248]|uniref:Anaphase-promoting complex subunit 4 WD40 domain-containing protein n=1 Tax=[Candida] arabinofermentans NRRL YB-2248 TaxID=983967 RepID=A0A1E4SYD3_9ASCO|nr:hypothetical protein CANARDRAFT_235673 [[Candida] arabinofermentans NRRL YB-2248]